MVLVQKAVNFRVEIPCCSLKAEFRPLLSLLLRPPTCWMKPTHLIESYLLYSKFNDFNINHFKKNIFTATSRLMLDQIIGRQSLIRLTHKIDHHDIPCKIVISVRSHQCNQWHLISVSFMALSPFHTLFSSTTCVVPAPAGNSQSLCRPGCMPSLITYLSISLFLQVNISLMRKHFCAFSALLVACLLPTAVCSTF